MKILESNLLQLAELMKIELKNTISIFVLDLSLLYVKILRAYN